MVVVVAVVREGWGWGMRDGKRERDVGCSIFCTRATRARAVILKIEFEPRTMERLPTMEHTIVRKRNKREKHLTGIRNTTPQHIVGGTESYSAYAMHRRHGTNAGVRLLCMR